MTNTNGSKWIRPQKRLAIYLRDGMACAYCGTTVEDGTLLTLDHIKPRSKGGNNHEHNLITCCQKCNSSRGNRTRAEFISAVAQYINHGITSAMIEKHIRNCRARKLGKYVVEAKEIKARRIMEVSE